MARLPTVGDDTNAWGTVLNTYLQVGHNAGGTNTGTPTVFNVKDDAWAGGAKGDGTTDDTAAIAACRLAAYNSLAGNEVYYPAGTYISTTQTIYSNVTEKGAGKTATIIKLKNGTNADLFSAKTANINLNGNAGSGPGPTSADCVYNFHFEDLTLDGNRANNPSGPSYPLRFYGYGHTLKNVIVQHGRSGGILCDYYGPFPDQNAGSGDGYNGMLEYMWDTFHIVYNTGMGVEIGGPTDGQWDNGIVAESGSHNIHICPNANALMASNVHAWYPGQGNHSVNWLLEGDIHCSNCEAEGSDYVQVALITNNGMTWVGGQIFAGGHGGAGIQIGQTPSSFLVNGLLAQAAGVPIYTNPNGYLIDTLFYGITHANGAIWFVNDGWGVIQASIENTNKTNMVTGTPFAATIINLQIQWGGLVPDGTIGKGGGQIFASNSNTGMSVTDAATGNSYFNADTYVGNVVVGYQALATTATNGFFYIPTCAGAPTGVPTAKTGRAPMIYDTTNHKFWIYDTAWKGIVLT